jgi:hypothetical protein
MSTLPLSQNRFMQSIPIKDIVVLTMTLPDITIFISMINVHYESAERRISSPPSNIQTMVVQEVKKIRKSLQKTY